jgi:hypothetical protein
LFAIARDTLEKTIPYPENASAFVRAQPFQIARSRWVQRWVESWAEGVGFELGGTGVRMVQLIERLTVLKISKLTQPGYYADGGGLY